MAYATVEQANAYIHSYYSSTETLRKKWEALTDADKQVYLNKAERIIDQLPYKGKAVSETKAFPRKPNEEYSLEQAKLATIELGIQQLDDEASDRADLQAQGVKSYKIGDLSETFKDNKQDLINYRAFSIVYPFLCEWLGGGFRICPTHIKRFHGLRF